MYNEINDLHKYIENIIYIKNIKSRVKNKMPFDKKIIKSLIDLKNISVSKVAESCEINQANLSRFLRDKPGGYISDEKITRISRFLGINEKEELLEGIHWWYLRKSTSLNSFFYVIEHLLPSGGIGVHGIIDCPQDMERGMSSYMPLLILFVLYPHDHPNSRIVLLDLDKPWNQQFQNPKGIQPEFISLSKENRNKIMKYNKSLTINELDQILGRVRTMKEEKQSPENKIDRYAEMLLGVLPAEGGKELLFEACRPVDPKEPAPEIPEALRAVLVGTPLEPLLKNDFLFGTVCGAVISRIWRKEGRL